MLVTNAVLGSILEMGIRAPSLDNLQRWRFRVLSNEEVELLVPGGGEESFFEVENKTAYIAAGSVLENVRAAATHFGLETETRLFPEGKNPLCVARIRFKKFLGPKDPLGEALGRRCTNRACFDPHKKIHPLILARSASEAAKEPGFQLCWIERGSAAYGRLARAIAGAERARFEHPHFHEQLMSSLRFTADENDSRGDGLNVRSLEAPGRGLFFKCARPWRRMERMNRFGLSQCLGLRAWIRMRASAAAGLVVSPDMSAEHCVKGGMLLERAWLRLAAENIAAQPMTALVLFATHSGPSRDKFFSAPQQKVFGACLEDLLKSFGLPKESVPLFFFRAGYASRQPLRSRRRPLESFLVTRSG